jgi:hypothetical protein
MEILRDSIRFSDNQTDITGTVTHPFGGLPVEVIGQLGADGATGVQYYFNQMLSWDGPAAEGTSGNWILSGTTGVATITASNVRFGEIILTADSTGSANPTLQFGSIASAAPFLYTVGKRMWCFIRMALGTVATTEVFFGLATPDTSPTVTGTFPSDGIFFHKASTATKLSFAARKDGTSTDKSLVSGTLTDGTYTTIGFRIGLLGNLMPYQDGSVIAAGVIPVGTANIPTAAADVLQPIIGILGASMTMKIDWVLFAQER